MAKWSGRRLITHLPLVPHICFGKLGRHWFRYWLVAFSAPSHYLKQCWLIVDWNLMNKLKYENVVWERVAILSRGIWVKSNPEIIRSFALTYILAVKSSKGNELERSCMFLLNTPHQNEINVKMRQAHNDAVPVVITLSIIEMLHNITSCW